MEEKKETKWKLQKTMNDEFPIYVGEGVLAQIKNPSYIYPFIITREFLFNTWMDMFKEFYEKYPDAVKLDYEKIIREILDYPNKN